MNFLSIKILGCHVCLFRTTIPLHCPKTGEMWIKKGYESATAHSIWMWASSNTLRLKAEGQHFNLIVTASFQIQYAGGQSRNNIKHVTAQRLMSHTKSKKNIYVKSSKYIMMLTYSILYSTFSGYSIRRLFIDKTAKLKCLYGKANKAVLLIYLQGSEKVSSLCKCPLTRCSNNPSCLFWFACGV